jgi:hypothetical protein
MIFLGFFFRFFFFFLGCVCVLEEPSRSGQTRGAFQKTKNTPMCVSLSEMPSVLRVLFHEMSLVVFL